MVSECREKRELCIFPLIFAIELRYNTIRATCARRGNFRELNFNYDIGRKLLLGLIPQWDLFFQEIANHIQIEASFPETHLLLIYFYR